MKNLLNYIQLQLMFLLHFFGWKFEKLSFDHTTGHMENLKQRINEIDSETEKFSFDSAFTMNWPCPPGWTKSKDGTFCYPDYKKKDTFDPDFYGGKFDEVSGFMVDGAFIPMAEAQERNQYDKDFLRHKKPIKILLPKVFGQQPVSVPTFTPRDAPRPSLSTQTVSPTPLANALDILDELPIRELATEAQLSRASEFDITITKTIINAGIPNNLPVVLFSPMFRDSDYSTLIGQLPAGVTLTVANSGTDDIAFTYVDGVDSVILTVSGGQTPYRSIVSALRTDRFDMVRVRESISLVTQLGQLNLSLQVSTGSMFGGQTFNTVSALAAKGPFQEQDTIIDFNFKAKFDKAKAMRLFILGTAPTGFSVTLAMWAIHVVKN